jgi:RNA polymerase sigma-70 factor (ECF subfamily)
VDRGIVERASSGDRQAFAQLAAEASDRLYSIAIRILRDADAASDALQGTLVQIWRDLPTLRDPERFDAWSYRVIARRCRDELRRRRRRLSTLELLGSDAAIADVQVTVSLRDELERAFDRLSAEHRAVLVLRYYEDLPLARIGEVLDVSEGTVKSRLHYAREALRAAVEADARAGITQGRLA